MKTGILVSAAIVILLQLSVRAQLITTPQVSPRALTKQTIGLSTVEIDYGRPAVKGREIWGKLVPYGLTTLPFGAGNPAPWRAGANENTVITFSHDVLVEGHSLPAGSYGFHIIVNPDEWTLIFSNNYSSWGSFFYDEAEDALRVNVTPEEAPHQEWLLYGFEDLTPNSATVFVHWEKLKAGFKVEFATDVITLESIKNELRGPAGFSWQGYQQAAAWCLQNEVHLSQGVKWINESISINENQQNRNLLGYLLMAQGKMSEAGQVFKENLDKFPDDWNVYDSMGEFYKNSGDNKNAKKWYQKALKTAPDNQKNRIEKILQN